jgi:hypothetical protein
MAVGTKANDTVLVYYDVLAGDNSQEPDVVLDNATSMIDQPRSILITNGDLYVANVGNDTVTIFRNYLSLTDNQIPDAVLTDTTAGISKPKQILVVNDTLIVNNGDGDEILFFNNAGSISADVAPDVTLDNGGSGISNPSGIAVAGNRLYVGNFNADNILIFNDITSLTDGQAADITLDNGVSMVESPQKLFVANNILYAFQPFITSENLLIFSPADGLTDGQAPDAVLDDTSGLDTPNSGLVIGNRLFVGNRRTGSETDGPALVIFDNADNITSGQLPAASLGPDLLATEDLAETGGHLFVNNNDVHTDPTGLGSVAIYGNPTALDDGALPQIFLDDTDFFGGSQVSGLAVNLR